jgi:hypothetical protein
VVMNGHFSNTCVAAGAVATGGVIQREDFHDTENRRGLGKWRVGVRGKVLFSAQAFPTPQTAANEKGVFHNSKMGALFMKQVLLELNVRKGTGWRLSPGGSPQLLHCLVNHHVSCCSWRFGWKSFVAQAVGGYSLSCERTASALSNWRSTEIRLGAS